MTQQEQKDWTENVRWADDRQVLLDDFARAAMHAMLTTPKKLPELSGERLAEMAYIYAETMMQERERRVKG